MKLVTQISAFIGAILAVVSLWAILGIATSGDIRTLDRKQVETAIEVHRRSVRDGILLAPTIAKDPDSPAAKIWAEDLAQARQDLKRAQDRKIELSK